MTVGALGATFGLEMLKSAGNITAWIDKLEKTDLKADKDAYYIQDIQLDLNTVRPHISGPNHVKAMISISEAESKDIKINKAYLVSCVNSRVEDLTEAAKTIQGNKVAPHVEL